jgi:hypothetical protein
MTPRRVRYRWKTPFRMRTGEIPYRFRSSGLSSDIPPGFPDTLGRFRPRFKLGEDGGQVRKVDVGGFEDGPIPEVREHGKRRV